MAVINPLLVAGAEIGGARRRVARTEAEIGPLGEAIDPELVRERLRAMGSPREAAEAAQRRHQFFQQLRNMFDPARLAQMRQQQEIRLRAEVAVTAEPSEDLIPKVSRAIMKREIEGTWRDLQAAMS
jgi:hypothetical protein